MKHFWVIVGLLCLLPLSAGGQPATPYRVGFSKTIFGEVNENDAVAAVRVWAQTIVQERGIPADPQPIIFNNTDQIIAALTNDTSDCFNITTGEYDAVKKEVAGDWFVAGVVSGSIMEEYVLLVHRGSDIQSVSDLRGRRLGLLRTARASLAPVWLDTLLAREGLGRVTDFFGKVTSATNIGKAVLPVFFRQVDACVVTRSGLDTMTELNPQTGQQLKALATSPPVLPVVFCFDANDTSLLREQIMDEITSWHLSPAGLQILTLFQIDSLEKHPADSLESALKLLAEHKQLFGETNPGSVGIILSEVTGRER